MRRFLALLVLSACTMTTPVDTSAPGVTGLDNSAIEVSPLAAAPAAPLAAPAPMARTATASVEGPVTAQVAGPNTPHPKPRPTAAGAATEPAASAEPVQTPAEETAPPVPISPQQALCEKTGGQWATAGDSGANFCSKRTKDGGKRCDSENDCQGRCLARSNTCSPIDPMLGCNEILDNDGRMVTMCLN